jgi:hypothetical protein
MSSAGVRELASLFSAHIELGLWNFIPVSEGLLRRTSALIVAAPGDLFIRTTDAVHLATALEIGERDVWTNDRHIRFALTLVIGMPWTKLRDTPVSPKT